MSKKSKVDLTTGLPEVPLGYRWKVRFDWPDYSTVPDVIVMLKKGVSTVVRIYKTLGYLDPRDAEAGRSGWERKYDYIVADPDEYADIIFQTALYALEKEQKQIDNDKWRARYENTVKNLKGNYPPKKLER